MAHDEQLRFMADRARTFMHAYGPGAPSLQLALPLMRVSLSENIRHALTLAAHGQPIEDRYLAMQLRAFNDLRLQTA